MRDDDMVKIGSLFDLFGCSDEDLYAKGTIEDALYDGTLPAIAAPRWHRVEEPPKEERRTYLVYTDTGYMFSCRWTNNLYGLGESDRWGWSIADVPQFQKVTHWMPLPDAPEAEE